MVDFGAGSGAIQKNLKTRCNSIIKNTIFSGIHFFSFQPPPQKKNYLKKTEKSQQTHLEDQNDKKIVISPQIYLLVMLVFSAIRKKNKENLPGDGGYLENYIFPRFKIMRSH